MSKQKVFFSHSHFDCHSAVDLQAVLTEHGAKTYLDQDKIQVADDLPERIREGIDWCNAFLLLWSDSAASSLWVEREWNMAYDSRKKIIPYVLDHAPLPPALENLVHVEAKDQQHGNAHLLKAVFGKGFQPSDSTSLFPGRWQTTVDALGMVQGDYNLELRDNGQVEGEGGITDSGVAGSIASELGMSDLLTMRIPVHGSWSYERQTQILTIEISAQAFGRQQNDTIRIRATGHERGAIIGKDLAGRTWTLRRVEERARSRPEERTDFAERRELLAERQQLRNALQNMYANGGHTPVFAGVMVAVIEGFAEDKNRSLGDLGLPTEKVKRLSQALQANPDQATLQAAYEDLMGWLRQAGWIKD